MGRRTSKTISNLVNSDNQTIIDLERVMYMIVKTIKRGECICHIDDSAYIDRTEEEVRKIIKDYSVFITSCLLKTKTA